MSLFIGIALEELFLGDGWDIVWRRGAGGVGGDVREVDPLVG